VDQVLRGVALQDLRQPTIHRQMDAVRTRGHVGVGERVQQVTRRGGELVLERVEQAAFLSFNHRAGVVGHQRAQTFVRLLDVSQVPGTIKRVEARGRETR
jgi:hypothetical protein